MTHNSCNSLKEKGKKWQGKREIKNKDITKKEYYKETTKGGYLTSKKTGTKD